MTDAVSIAAILASSAAALASLGALITSIRNRNKIEQVHVEFNSKMDAYLKTRQDLADTKETAAYAKGKEDQRQAEK